MNIGEIVSKAIKESKWLNISYINKNGENTFYWVAIKDIDFNNKTFYVSAFNDKKSLNTFDTWISFNNIQNAEIIEFSSYERSDELINKIERNLDNCSWLNYDHFNHNVLNYYAECSILDNDPVQKEYTTIPGIDLLLLRKNKKFELNEEQIKRIIADIYHYNIKNNSNSYYTLAINCFSIDEGQKKFVIAYYSLTFDPLQKSLILDKHLRFNPAFMVDGRRHSLFNYINMDTDYFAKTFESKYKEYQQIIQSNLRPGEYVDTRPDIMLIQRDVPIDLSETYSAIEERYLTNSLTVPLKSFFGNITKKNNLRRKEPSLII
jgi:hypothetical protein